MTTLWSRDREIQEIARKVPDPLSMKAGSGNETRILQTPVCTLLTLSIADVGPLCWGHTLRQDPVHLIVLIFKNHIQCSGLVVLIGREE